MKNMRLTKRGPWKGFLEIKMPKVSWQDMEDYGAKMWNVAIKEAVRLCRTTKRKPEIVKELKRQLVKQHGK